MKCSEKALILQLNTVKAGIASLGKKVLVLWMLVSLFSYREYIVEKKLCRITGFKEIFLKCRMLVEKVMLKL